MPLNVGPISLNDLGEAYFSNAKVNHLTSVPVYFDEDGPCGPLLVRGLAGSNLSGRNECTDLINPVTGYSYKYTGLLDPQTGAKKDVTTPSVVSLASSYLGTSALVRAAYATLGYIQRGADLVLLLPNGNVKDQVRIITDPLVDSCQGAIGYRRTIIHNTYVYNTDTCEYSQGYSEVFKFYWNTSFITPIDMQQHLSAEHLSSNAASMPASAVTAVFSNTSLSGYDYIL